MVFVPGGTFSIGSDRHYPEEAPVYRVTVNGYWSDRSPITNSEFQRFVKATCHVTVAERPRPRRETVRRWSSTCLLHHSAPKRTWV
jgi:formylglycine-generating enzyme